MNMWGNVLWVLNECMAGMVSGKNAERRRLSEFCAWQTHGFVK